MSLDFVPHVVGTSVKWHSSPKTARIDLGYEPHNFHDEWDFTAQEWTISPDLGYPTPAERAASIANALPDTAEPWLEAITDVASLTRAFEREEARAGGQFLFDDYVQYRLAFAFALARDGQRVCADGELRRWARRNSVAPQLEDQLRTLLSAVG